MSNNTPHITCIGLSNVDVIANVDEDFIVNNKIALGASTLLDSIQMGNLLGKLESPDFFPGGCAANTACGLSLFGVDTTFVGKTGDDIYADIFRRGFDGHNIRFETPAHALKMTSTCITLVTPDKNRSFGICTDTAGWFLDKDDLPNIPDSDNESVYMEANSARIPPNRSNCLLNEAMHKYGKGNINLYLNLNDWEIVSKSRETLRETMNFNIAFYIGNVEEISALFETKNNVEALKAAQESGKNFAITNGADGVYIIENGKADHMDAAPLHKAQIKNTVGAGDQFAAGFIAGRMTGMSAKDACMNGIRAATEILQKKDARPNPKNFKLKLEKEEAA